MIGPYFRAFGQLGDPAFRRPLLRGLLGSLAVFAGLWASIVWILTHTAVFETPWLDTTLDALGGLAALVLTFLLYPAMGGDYSRPSLRSLAIRLALTLALIATIVNWARDFGNGAGVPGVLQARVTVDGVPATIDFGASDDDTIGYGNTLPVDGILSVGAGNHTVAFQIREVGAGNSFIYGSQFNTLFTPFGNAGGQGQIGRPDSSDGSAQPQG